MSDKTVAARSKIKKNIACLFPACHSRHVILSFKTDLMQKSSQILGAFWGARCSELPLLVIWQFVMENHHVQYLIHKFINIVYKWAIKIHFPQRTGEIIGGPLAMPGTSRSGCRQILFLGFRSRWRRQFQLPFGGKILGLNVGFPATHFQWTKKPWKKRKLEVINQSYVWNRDVFLDFLQCRVAVLGYNAL